jgi:hypothetical protein
MTATVRSPVLFRGPAVLAIAVFSIAISVLQALSPLAIIQLILLLIGITLSCYDLSRISNNNIRAFLKRQIDSVVWDDALYKFFHPEMTWFRLFTETLIGQAWMYCLPFTSAQRVRLLQATLRIDEVRAQHILFAPGGFKEMLLPQSFLRYLDGGDVPAIEGSQIIRNSCKDFIVITSDGDAESSSSSEAVSSSSEGLDSQVSGPDRSSIAVPGTKTDTTSQDKKESMATVTTPALPYTISSVMLELISTQLSEIVAYSRDSRAINALGIAAAAGLALQLRFSSRARKIILGVLETASITGLSAVAFGAAGLALTKAVLPKGPFHVDERNLHKYIGFVLHCRKTLSESFSSDKDNGQKRLKALVYATLVLLCLGIKRHRQHYRQKKTSQHNPHLNQMDKIEL